MLFAGDYFSETKRVCLTTLGNRKVFANLEAPIVLSEHCHPVPKSGPSLRSRRIDLNGRNFVFNLANNHMMDYGEVGLCETVRELDRLCVPHCGAGNSVDEARRPIIVEEDGKRIGIIGCCEHQFGCADINTGGCAEKGLWILPEIKKLRDACDFVIVSCHAALEHSPLPSPRLREFYRLLIDSGVNIVHGHHSHVPQAWECYHGGYIFYGLGNFAVDPKRWSGRNHKWSLAFNVDFAGNGMSVSLVPYGVFAQEDSIVVRPLDGDSRRVADEYLDYWNKTLLDEGRYLGAWQTICSYLYDSLYGVFLKTPRYSETKTLTTRNRIRYAHDGLLMLVSAALGRKVNDKRTLSDGRTTLNMFWCESHADTISTALAVMSGSVRDLRNSDVLTTFLSQGLNILG